MQTDHNCGNAGNETGISVDSKSVYQLISKSTIVYSQACQIWPGTKVWDQATQFPALGTPVGRPNVSLLRMVGAFP